MSSHYRILTPKGTVVADASGGAGCYGTYTHHPWNGKNVVEIFIKKTRSGYNGTPFTREQVKDYIVNLINSGFPCRLHEEAKQYVVTIEEKYYYNFSHMRTMLDYIRTLWEGVIIPRQYYSLPESYRSQHDFFMLIQAISILHPITTGYPVPSGSYQSIVPSHELLDYCRKNRSHHKGCQHLWHELREGGTKAPRSVWTNSKYAPFIREVKDMIAGKPPKVIFDTLSKHNASVIRKPSEAAVTLRKLVRRKPVATTVG